MYILLKQLYHYSGCINTSGVVDAVPSKILLVFSATTSDWEPHSAVSSSSANPVTSDNFSEIASTAVTLLSSNLNCITIKILSKIILKNYSYFSYEAKLVV